MSVDISPVLLGSLSEKAKRTMVLDILLLAGLALKLSKFLISCNFIDCEFFCLLLQNVWLFASRLSKSHSVVYGVYCSKTR